MFLQDGTLISVSELPTAGNEVESVEVEKLIKDVHDSRDYGKAHGIS